MARFALDDTNIFVLAPLAAKYRIKSLHQDLMVFILPSNSDSIHTLPLFLILLIEMLTL
jgi:hypothetical protein